MSDAVKEITALGLVSIVLLGTICHFVIKETEVEYSYKVEALEATQGCEACQMVILAKGHN